MSEINTLLAKAKEILRNHQNQHKSEILEKTDKLLVIIISKQKIFLFEKENICFETYISTSKYGIGNDDGSFKTPIGIHTVSEKIGEGQPKYTVFKARQPTNKYDLENIPDEDLITTRIIWLCGAEPEVNLGGNVDTFSRYIYIHGTPHEKEIGTPVSHGCIRMKNEDIINLFQQVDIGTPVIIIND